jgi:hypothetical protein
VNSDLIHISPHSITLNDRRLINNDYFYESFCGQSFRFQFLHSEMAINYLAFEVTFIQMYLHTYVFKSFAFDVLSRLTYQNGLVAFKDILQSCFATWYIFKPLKHNLGKFWKALQ